MRVPVLRERSPIRGYSLPPPSRHPSPLPPQELETPSVGIVLAGEHTQIEDVDMAVQNLETPIEGISSPAAPQHPYNDHGLVGKTIWSFDYESYTDPKSKHVVYSESGAARTKEPMTPDSVQQLLEFGIMPEFEYKSYVVQAYVFRDPKVYDRKVMRIQT
jgi:hypothetical protein